MRETLSSSFGDDRICTTATFKDAATGLSAAVIAELHATAAATQNQILASFVIKETIRICARTGRAKGAGRGQGSYGMDVSWTGAIHWAA